MITKIISLLQQRKPNAPKEWINKLPDMARRLEDSLYRMAPSRDEYNNFQTLKHRLQQLAMSMGGTRTNGAGASPRVRLWALCKYSMSRVPHPVTGPHA